mmetsp:Transcript_17472/g.22127  ORF Transcript_17472/g.22127 Transcript_17472/m.22127 type:complete len:81 (+) Transcript_17472:225-467(+)
MPNYADQRTELQAMQELSVSDGHGSAQYFWPEYQVIVTTINGISFAARIRARIVEESRCLIFRNARLSIANYSERAPQNS